MPTQSVSEAEWDLHKATIYDLWSQPKRILNSIMQIMQKDYDFRPTKSQYEDRFRKWGWKKNKKADTWRFIAHRVEKRKRDKKESDVKINGEVIEYKKVKKEISRYGFVSTIEKAFSIPMSPKTPPGVDVCTPTDVVIYDGSSTALDRILHVSSPSALSSMFPSPWRQTVDFLDHFLSLPARSSSPGQSLPSSFRAFAQYLEPDPALEISLDARRGRSYLENFTTLSDRDLIRPRYHSANDLAFRGSQLELFKAAIILFSNGGYDGAIASHVVKLCEHRSNLLALRRLLDQRLYCVEPFAERILIPAIEEGNLALVQMLIQGGVDVNAKYWNNKAGDDETPMDTAVRVMNLEAVKLLDQHGAIYDVTSHDIAFALTSNEEELFRFLLDNRPALSTTESVELMERVAGRGSVANIRALLQRGLSIHTVYSDGHGSPLAAAIDANNVAVVHYLLGSKADVNGIARRFYTYRSLSTSGWVSCSVLRAAVAKEDGRLIAKLLEEGANPNDPRCSPTPLQHACLDGAQQVAAMLLNAGANPNQFDHTLSSNAMGGKPPIQLAIENGHLELSDLLTSQGAEIAHGNWNLLVSACLGKLHDLVETLLVGTATLKRAASEITACVTCFGCDQVGQWIDKDLIDYAALLQSPQAVCAVIEDRGGDLLSRLILEERRKGRALYPECAAAGLAMAAKLGDVGIVKLFLDAGVRPDATVTTNIVNSEHAIGAPKRFYLYRGTDALLEALKSPSKRYKLLPRCSEVELMAKFIEVLKLLLRTRTNAWREPDKDIFSQHRTHHYLYHALQQGCLEIVKAFVEETSIDLCHFVYEHSPLQQALDYSHGTSRDISDTVEFLIDSGTNVDCSSVTSSWGPRKEQSFHTALQYAASHDNLPLVKVLLGHGASVNSKPPDDRGATALQFAAINGNIKMASVLLEAGADINAPPCKLEGRSAIEGAAEHGRLSMVHYLLENGADIQGKTNTTYRRAWWLAWSARNGAIARYIQDYKTQRFGEDDCDTEEHLLRSVPKRELREEMIVYGYVYAEDGEESEDDLDRAYSWRD
ncbi:ankyrin [Lophiostoma macrostomum CBS 122681]|uniref:Ankyrin n=1 Tax=Lophiostoma macrostomum CBS 122681 TaxID=1314788 RepID=A0A6A6T243_9PLEO|nr:ankyrin [Lophiostoma macrostomum CBS 122681]